MKIKNQFRLSILFFVIILTIIAASIFTTEQQTTQLNNQVAVAQDIQSGASDLSYLSTNFFLYQDNQDLTLWQSRFSLLSYDLSKLNPDNPQQQVLLGNVGTDLQHLSEVFNSSVSFLENAPRNVSVRVLPGFQTNWNRMTVQNQALTFDSQKLSQVLHSQADQLNSTNIILILAFLGVFGAYFIMNYLITYRNTLNSIHELQNGIAEIGSGNLDYSLNADKKDEIGEVSKSVNKMAANLKTVTASKTELERAQALLRESEERWATTLSSIGDAVIATDITGNVTFMNGVAEELTGWTLAEASRNSVEKVFNIISEQSRLRVENPVTKVLEKGMIVGLANHTVLVRKDGTELPIDDSGAPIKNKEGQITGVVLIFRDITERRKAEEALAKKQDELQTIIDSSQGWIFYKDTQNHFVRVNKSFAEVMDLPQEQLEGRSLFELYPRKEAEAYWKDDKEVMASAKSKIGIVEEMHSKMGHRWVQTDKIPYLDVNGKIIGVIGFSVDITERKQAEAKLEEYAKNLEGIVEERTKALKDSERLAAIGATAGMVGHDIRNPLQAITSDVYLAKTDLASTLDSEEKQNALESLDEIEKNVGYINKIVADLQDYARTIRPLARETSIRTVVDDILAKNNIPSEIKIKVTVEKRADLILADPDLLRRVIGNLVTNAVQAMPKGGKLSINSSLDAKGTVITVEDTGVGIPEDARSKLFTPLFTTKSKGQGFGLAVVKRMTEALGGTVTFESKVGKGTKFIVRLPPKVLNGKFVYKE